MYSFTYIHLYYIFLFCYLSQFLLSRVLFINFLRWKNHQESRMLCLGGLTTGSLTTGVLLFLHLHFYIEHNYYIRPDICYN